MAMAMARLDRVIVAVHYGRDPTEEEWQRWIDLVLERAGREIRVLVEAYGVGPNAKQRKQLAAATAGQDQLAAILTDSIITRGVVTAIAWLGVALRAFPMAQRAQAAEYLGLTQQERAAVERLLPELRRACGVHDDTRLATSA